MPIISDMGGMYEYQRFRFLEGKWHNTLSKTLVRYKEPLCEALQKHIFVYRTHVSLRCENGILGWKFG